MRSELESVTTVIHLQD